MKQYFLLQFTIEPDNSIGFLEQLRSVARNIAKQGICESFTIVNRSKEKRVDCYLFDVGGTESGLAQVVKECLSCPFELVAVNHTAEMALVKHAGIVVELLLAHYETNQLYNILLQSHLHYIMNSLGNDYLTEASIYDQFSQQLKTFASGANVS